MDMDQVPGSLNDGGQNCTFTNWHDAFPEPRSAPSSISVEELTVLLRTKTIGKDFVVVDVRRTDFEVDLAFILFGEGEVLISIH